MSRWLVEKGSSLLEARTSRRGFLFQTAMVGSALAVAPLRYLLRPVTAYAAICACAGTDCDCGSACCDGYTDFCCSVNDGSNTCPPGTFEAGWWRADGSTFCEGPRYYVDCNASCGSPIGYPCTCGRGSCDNRRSGCNQFRYGNCNAGVECYGPIVCRVVSCTPPYQTYPACDQTTLWDNSTANHAANCDAPVPPPPAARGEQVTSVHSGKVLDVAEYSTADGGRIWQWSPTGAANQQWVAEQQADGSYRIISSHSGKVLDVADYSTADGGRIHQWSWHGGPNQRWTIEDLGDGSVKIANVNSGKVLDVADYSTADGGRIHQWSWHGGPNQRWRGLRGTAPAPAGPGRQIVSAHSGKALDVSEFSQADGATVWQWSLTNGPNQRWVLEPQADGTYRIVAAHSGKVLDVAEYSTADGGRIHQWSWHGGPNQRWRVEPLGDGTARIVSVHSGKVLDVAEFSTADGGRIHQWSWHGGPNQRWRGAL